MFCFLWTQEQRQRTSFFKSPNRHRDTTEKRWSLRVGINKQEGIRAVGEGRSRAEHGVRKAWNSGEWVGGQTVQAGFLQAANSTLKTRGRKWGRCSGEQRVGQPGRQRDRLEEGGQGSAVPFQWEALGPGDPCPLRNATFSNCQFHKQNHRVCSWLKRFHHSPQFHFEI